MRFSKNQYLTVGFLIEIANLFLARDEMAINTGVRIFDHRGESLERFYVIFLMVFIV